MNFKILYPDFLFTGAVTMRPTAAAGFSATNVFNGSKGMTFKAASTSTTTIWKINMGIATAPDCFYLSKANLNLGLASGLVITLDGSTVSSFATIGQTITLNKTATDLVGSTVQPEDIFSTFSGNAYKYWRITVTTSSSIVHQYGKMYFGRAFEFEQEPSVPLHVDNARQSYGAQRKAGKNFTLTVEGVSDSKFQDFINKIARYKESNMLVLSDENIVRVLGGQKLITARLVSFTHTPVTIGINTLNLNFVEAV